VVTSRVLAAGESQHMTWELVAQTTDGTPLQPGSYVLEADPVISSRVTLQHPLVIR
jgi:hypothetical protein